MGLALTREESIDQHRQTFALLSDLSSPTLRLSGYLPPPAGLPLGMPVGSGVVSMKNETRVVKRRAHHVSNGCHKWCHSVLSGVARSSKT